MEITTTTAAEPRPDPFALGGKEPPKLQQLRELAETEFEPIEDAAAAEEALRWDWHRRVDALGTNLVMAAHFLSKTKAELVEIARGLDNEALMDVIESLGNAGQETAAFEDLVLTAYARMMIAAAVIATEEAGQ